MRTHLHAPPSHSLVTDSASFFLWCLQSPRRGARVAKTTGRQGSGSKGTRMGRAGRRFPPRRWPTRRSSPQTRSRCVRRGAVEQFFSCPPLLLEAPDLLLRTPPAPSGAVSAAPWLRTARSGAAANAGEAYSNVAASIIKWQVPILPAPPPTSHACCYHDAYPSLTNALATTPHRLRLRGL